MKLTIYHEPNGAYITCTDGKHSLVYSPFQIGEIIKHRLKMDGGRIVEIEIDGFDGDHIRAKSYFISHERAFEENPRTHTAAELLKIISTLPIWNEEGD